MEELSDTSTEILNLRSSELVIDHESEDSSSTEIDLFSESSDSVDNLLEEMDEQINDLYQICKCQKEEIEELKKRVDSLKSIIQSHLIEHLNNIISFI